MKRFIPCLILLIACTSQAQVQLQTGAAVFDIPVFNYKDGKSGLSSNVVLSYSSGNGLRVNQVASCVGLGWTLNAGGFIERLQCGEPDDQYDNTFTLPATDQIVAQDNLTAYEGYYPNGFLYSEFTLADIPKELAVQPRFQTGQNKKYKLSPRAYADREQDYFAINLNGRLAVFAIGKNGSVELLDDSKLQITFSVQDMRAQNIRTKIYEFNVTDEFGVKYKFAATELSELLNYEPTLSDNNNFSLSVLGAVYTGKYVINKWQLTEIKNPFTNETITFTYNDLIVDFLTEKTPVYQKIPAQSVEGVVITEGRTKIQTKQLKQITYPDGTTVKFNYGTRRWDFDDENLSYILVEGPAIPTRKFNLTQRYFLKNVITSSMFPSVTEIERLYLRLCLTEVWIEGSYARGQGEFKLGRYYFDYYTGSEISNPKSMVPMRYSFAQDHWGYYNLSSLINDDLTVYDKYAIKDLISGYATSNTREPYALAARAGVLKAITYPTGGKLTYEYEQNTFNNGGVPINVGGVHVSKTILHDLVTTANDQVTEYKYINADGTSSCWGYETPTYELFKNITVRYDASGFSQGGLLIYSKAAQFQIKTISSAISTVATTAILEALGLSTMNPIGITISAIVSYLVNKLVTVMYSWIIQDETFGSYTYSFVPLFSSNPVGLQFNRVQVKNISLPDPIGRTVYEYTKPDNPADILTSNFPYSKKQRLDAWKYGLLKKTTAYDKLDVPVKESEVSYNFPSLTLDGNFRSVKIDANQMLSSRYDYFAANRDWVSDTWISKEYYYLKKGRIEVSQNREKIYGKNGRYFENTTGYSYNANPVTDNYLPREVSTLNSKNEVVGKTIYYSKDYTSPGPLAAMVSSHIYNVPVAELSWIQPAGSPRKYTGARVTEFITLANGEIKPYKIYVAQNDAPVAASLVPAFDPNTAIYNYPNLKLVLTNTYDNNGILLKVTDEGNRRSSFIYDLNDRILSATVINADPADIAYSSFESPKTGNWTVNTPGSTSTFDPLNTPTGNYFSAMSSSQVSGQAVFTKLGLTASRQYIVSYWSNAGVIYANGQTVSPTYVNPVTGWALYIYQISGVTQVQLTGEGNIDELRLYPADARMRTVAYDWKVGMQAECDENNRIIYYSYDRGGRVIFVQDQEKNVIKTYEYNVVNK